MEGGEWGGMYEAERGWKFILTLYIYVLDS